MNELKQIAALYAAARAKDHCPEPDMPEAELYALMDGYQLTEEKQVTLLHAAGCPCPDPLLGWQPKVGPRCRLCNTVAPVEPEPESSLGATPPNPQILLPKNEN